MAVSVIPHSDNMYSYLVMDKKRKVGAVIDTGRPELIIEEVKKREITLEAILCTDNLPDFTRGNKMLLNAFDTANNKIKVVGRKQLPGYNFNIVTENFQFKVGGLFIKMIPVVLNVAGGNAMFLVQADNPLDPFHNPPKKKSALFAGKFVSCGGVIPFSRSEKKKSSFLLSSFSINVQNKQSQRMQWERL